MDSRRFVTYVLQKIKSILSSSKFNIMKSKSLHLVILLLSSLVFLGISNRALAVVVNPAMEEVHSTSDCTLSIFAPIQLSELPNMSRKEVEQKLNRRLKFKERMAFRQLRRHAKRMDGLEFNNDDCALLEKRAKAGVLFGILGLIIAGLIFGVVAIAAGSKAVKLAKANPDCPDAEKNRKKGSAGIILGVIDIIGSIVVLALIL